MLQRERGLANDIFERFEDFLQTHELLAKAPAILSPAGPLGGLVPRGFKTEDLKVPLAATGNNIILFLNLVIELFIILA